MSDATNQGWPTGDERPAWLVADLEEHLARIDEATAGAQSRRQEDAAVLHATAIGLEAAIGAKVRHLRDRRGWSQGDLAERFKAVGFEFHQTTIAKLESGKRPLRVAELFALAQVFGLPPAAFFYLPNPDDSTPLSDLDGTLRLIDETLDNQRRASLDILDQLAMSHARYAELRIQTLDRMTRAAENNGEHQEEA